MKNVLYSITVILLYAPIIVNAGNIPSDYVPEQSFIDISTGAMMWVFGAIGVLGGILFIPFMIYGIMSILRSLKLEDPKKSREFLVLGVLKLCLPGAVIILSFLLMLIVVFLGEGI